MLEVVEDVDVDLVDGAHVLDEVLQGVLQVVCVGELEDGLADLLAEPDDGLAAELGSPVAGADEPGSHHAGELAAGDVVDVQADVVVLLEEGGGIIGADFALGYAGHGVDFVFAPGHQDDLFGAEHGADADGDGLLGSDGDVAVEVAGLALAALVAQEDGAGAAGLCGAGLVESYLALLADAHDEEVEVADLLIELGAVGRNALVGDGAVGDVDVLREDVDVAEELLVETVVAALHLVRGGRIVFVD